MVLEYVKNGLLKILVKTNAKKSKVLGWDKERKALRVAIKALPKKGKANIEVVKFFAQLLGKRVIIKSGLTSKEKLIEIK